MQALPLMLALAAGPPSGWVALPTKAPLGETVRCANWSRREWSIQVTGDAIRPVLADDIPRQDSLPFPLSFEGAIPCDVEEPIAVRPDPALALEFPAEAQPPESRPSCAEWALSYGEKFARRYVLRLVEGWLIGFGGGEYGGSLWWYTQPDTRVRVAEGNVVDVLPVAQGREALVFIGIEHMDVSEGQVYRLTTEGGRARLRPLGDLGAAPRLAISAPAESVVVLTSDKLWRIAADGATESVCSVDSSHLYPRSLVALPSGDIWVGMRHYVARLRPRGTGACDVQWFAPADCPSFEVRGEECICRQ